MPKKSDKELKLDDKDIKLLDELQKDGRQSYRDLSKKLKIPESTVRKRINRLEKEKVIKKYQAVLDPKKVGKTVAAFFILKGHVLKAQLVQNLKLKILVLNLQNSLIFKTFIQLLENVIIC